MVINLVMAINLLLGVSLVMVLNLFFGLSLVMEISLLLGLNLLSMLLFGLVCGDKRFFAVANVFLAMTNALLHW